MPHYDEMPYSPNQSASGEMTLKTGMIHPSTPLEQVRYQMKELENRVKELVRLEALLVEHPEVEEILKLTRRLL